MEKHIRIYTEKRFLRNGVVGKYHEIEYDDRRDDGSTAVPPADWYYEVKYEEYREDGTLYCTGTEDFSGERLRGMKRYRIMKGTDSTMLWGKPRVSWSTVLSFNALDDESAEIYMKRIAELYKIDRISVSGAYAFSGAGVLYGYS